MNYNFPLKSPLINKTDLKIIKKSKLIEKFYHQKVFVFKLTKKNKNSFRIYFVKLIDLSINI
jgi:Ni2+-binding GTPase involved in maturation of urease and hydrogenase